MTVRTPASRQKHGPERYYLRVTGHPALDQTFRRGEQGAALGAARRLHHSGRTVQVINLETEAVIFTSERYGDRKGRMRGFGGTDVR